MCIVKSLEDLPSLHSDTSLTYTFDAPVRVLRICTPQDATENNYFHIYVTDYSVIGPQTWMADEVEHVKSSRVADPSIMREWKFLIIASRAQLQTLIEEKFKKSPKDVVLKQLPVLAQARFVVKRHVNGIFGCLKALDFNTSDIIAGLELKDSNNERYYAYARLFARFKLLATQDQIYLAEEVYNFNAKFGKLLDEIIKPTKSRKKGRQYKLTADTVEQKPAVHHKEHSTENNYTNSASKSVNVNTNNIKTSHTTNTDINKTGIINSNDDTTINESNDFAISAGSIGRAHTTEAPDSQDIRQDTVRFQADSESSASDKAADILMGTFPGETQPQICVVDTKDSQKIQPSSPRSKRFGSLSTPRTEESRHNTSTRTHQQMPSASTRSEHLSLIALPTEPLSSPTQEHLPVDSSKDIFSKQEDHSVTSVKRSASPPLTPSKKPCKSESVIRTKWTPGVRSISDLANNTLNFEKSAPTGADLLFHNQDDEDSQAPLFPPTQTTTQNYLTIETLLKKQQDDIIEEEYESTANDNLPAEIRSTSYVTSSANMQPPPSTRATLPNSSEPPLAQGSLPVPQTPRALQGVKRQSSSIPNRADNVHSQSSDNGTVVSPTIMPSQREDIELDIDISPPPTQPRPQDSCDSEVSSEDNQDKDSIGISILKDTKTYLSKSISIAQLLKVPLTIEEISKKQVYEVRGALIKGLQPFRPFIVKPFKRTIKVANFNIVLTDGRRDVVVEFHNEIEICHFLGVEEVEEVYKHLSTIEDDVIKLAKLEHPTTNSIRLIRKTKTARDDMLYPYWSCLSTLEDLIA